MPMFSNALRALPGTLRNALAQISVHRHRIARSRVWLGHVQSETFSQTQILLLDQSPIGSGAPPG